MITASGNEENIKFKRKLGFQAISDTMSILKELSAGSFNHGIGLILRDSVLKSKLLLNSEVWHGLSMTKIKSLEDIDKAFLRSILKAHSKVGVECVDKNS